MAEQNPWDRAGRSAVRLDPEAFFEWALNLPREELWFRGWLDTRNVPRAEDADQIRDTVARIADLDENGEPWAIVVEIQSRPDPNILGRINGYCGSLWEEQKPDPEPGSRFWVGALVVNLEKRGREIPRRQLSRTDVESLTPPKTFNLVDQDANTTLEKIETGKLGLAVLSWIPLTQGGDRPDIIRRWKSLGMTESDDQRRAHYGALVLFFAEKADCLDVWKEALKEWNVEESVILNEWTKKAEERGYAKGQEVGLEKGEQIGIQKGEQIGILNTLSIALRLKFGDEGLALVDELKNVNSLEKLREVQQAILDVGTLEDLRKIIVNDD
ncbi:MAG: hypothetical protein ACFCD0_27820 [Gemmataceae bacterium]